MEISGVNNINPSPASQSVNSEGAKGENQQVRSVNKVDRNGNNKGRSHDELEEFSEEMMDEVKEGVETLNESVEALHKGLKFQIHESSERMQVQVVDVIEDEVLKELPPEEVLDMLGRIQEMVGLIIDERI